MCLKTTTFTRNRLYSNNTLIEMTRCMLIRKPFTLKENFYQQLHHRQRDYCDANLLNVGKQQRFSLQKVTHTVLHFLTYTKDSWLWLSFLALPHNYQTCFGGFPESCCISPLKAQLCGLRNRVRSIKFNSWSRRRLRRPKMVNVWELLARRNFNLFPNSGKRCLIFKRDYKLFNRTTVF